MQDKIAWFIFEKFGVTFIGAFVAASVYWIYKHLIINWLGVLLFIGILMTLYAIGVIVVICILGLLDKINDTDSLNSYLKYLFRHKDDKDE